MAQLIVRNIEEKVKRSLRQRAKANGRSMEEEVRVILRTAVNGHAKPRASAGGRTSAGRGKRDGTGTD